MKITGFIALAASACALLSHVAASAPAQQNQPPEPAIELPQAFLTSKHVVYPFGAEIDLTFSITTPKEGEVLPHFKIENGDGEIVEARQVAGLYLWESTSKSFDGKEREGTLPAGERYTETIVDLRAWYEVDAPGNYRITFAGEWIDPEGQPHSLTSNMILLRITRPASEDEPEGEPMGRVIPLEEVWASRMPGLSQTRRIAATIPDGGFRPMGCTLLREIWPALSDMRMLDREGFLVSGNEMDALRGAHAVIVEGRSPQKVFQKGETVWLMFFTRMTQPFIVLEQIVDRGAVIEVNYKVVRHGWDASRPHFAMIPLRLDQLGTVRVEMRPAFVREDAIFEVNLRPVPPESLVTPTPFIAQSFEIEVVE